MDPKTLERLMLDDALGVLGDDVRALLAEHVAAAGPDAAARAESYRQAVDLARRALGGQGGEGPALPALPAADMLRRAAYRRWTGRAAALAACLVIGVGLGFAIFGHAPPVAPPAAAQVTAHAAPPAAPAAGVQDFWSVRRLAGMPAVAEPPAKPPWFAPTNSGGHESSVNLQ